MEALVLMGGFAAIGVLGYFLMSKLDNWLAALQKNEESLDQIPPIKIATSQPDSIPGITAALKELSLQYPDFRCTLLLGQEQEIANALACGSVDMAILSDHTAMSSMRCQDISMDPQPVSILDGMVEMRPLNRSAAHQRLLWKTNESRPDTLELICQLCGQP